MRVRRGSCQKQGIGGGRATFGKKMEDLFSSVNGGHSAVPCPPPDLFYPINFLISNVRVRRSHYSHDFPTGTQAPKYRTF